MHGLERLCVIGNITAIKQYVQLYQIDLRTDPASVGAMRAACSTGNRELVNWLHARGLDLHIEDYMPLRVAIAYDHLELAGFFLERGADLHSREDEAFRTVVERGRGDLALWIQRKGGVNPWASHNQAMNSACHRGDLEMVTWLIETFGPDHHRLDVHPLRKACYMGHLPVVRYLLSLGLPRDEWLLRWRDSLRPEIRAAIEDAFSAAGRDPDEVEGYQPYTAPGCERYRTCPQMQYFLIE